MSRAKREIPHYYLSTELDIGRATAWLAAANAERPPTERVLLSALLVKALALAARATPVVNGTYQESGFRPAAAVHVGFAVALRGGGLIAPAIHDADRKSLDAVMAALRDLVARARGGGLRSSELSDPTITLTSLGERGVEAVFPIIHPPQVAIVGSGKPVERPWVVDGGVVARPVLTLALAADHRVSDGHVGGLFLAEMARLLQTPEALR
jgi:pyruvate dehydrogenase E2 component (dihydrolipoamide acetyltransferase)